MLRPIGHRSTAAEPYTRANVGASPNVHKMVEGREEEGEVEGLASPPHLALDGSNDDDDVNDEVERSSDRTVDDVPVKVEEEDMDVAI